MRKEAGMRIIFGILLVSFFCYSFSLVIATEGTTDTSWNNIDFIMNSPDPYCWNDDSGTAFWVYSSGGIYASINDCHRNIVATGSDKDCCDSGYVCDTTTNRCISSEIGDCGDYKTQPDCVADAASVAVSSVDIKTNNLGYCQGFWLDEWDSGNVHCVNSTGSCRCAWKNGNCTADYNITKVCTDNTKEIIGTCSFSVSELTNCSTGFRIMKWVASWDPEGTQPADASCEDGQKNLPCPAQLSFISAAGIIIAVILLVALYLIMSRKKKTNKNVDVKIKGKKKSEK